MTTARVMQPGADAAQAYGSSVGGGQVANLGDILERVLDKGLVIAGDIQVNLLDIELLTIKLRLVIASLDTAREVGIDWWERDPWLSASAFDRAAGDRALEDENRQLRERVNELEAGQGNGGNAQTGRARREVPRSGRASREIPRAGRGNRGTARRMDLCDRRARRHDTPRPAQGSRWGTGPNGRGCRADRGCRRCGVGGVRRGRVAPQT